MKQLTSLFKEWCYRLMIFCTKHFLPERMKRIMFISSLATQLSSEKTLAPETMKQINSLMNLASDSSSMGLGSVLTHVIWTDNECKGVCMQLAARNEELDQKKLTGSVKTILKGAAPWLQYGPAGKMEEDISTLLRHRGAVFH